MWKVKAIQYRPYKYSEGYEEEKHEGTFESISEAQNFASLFLKAFQRSTVTISYTESNFEEEEEQKDDMAV